MTETAATTTVAPLGLLSRAIGVIVSPKATFENVVAFPRPVGILLMVAALIAIGSTAPQFTESGRQATLDAQVKAVERFGQTVTPEMYTSMEENSRSVPLKAVGIAGAFIMLPIFALIFAALYWAVFNTALGGTASFKEVLAIVTHSQVIGALGVLAALPVQLMKGTVSMAGPFNLGAFAPMLEESSKLATFLGSISVFSLWGMIVTGIGLGVLYRRSGRNIAIALVIVFLLVMFGITSVFSSFLGGAA